MEFFFRTYSLTNSNNQSFKTNEAAHDVFFQDQLLVYIHVEFDSRYAHDHRLLGQNNLQVHSLSTVMAPIKFYDFTPHREETDTRFPLPHSRF